MAAACNSSLLKSRTPIPKERLSMSGGDKMALPRRPWLLILLLSTVMGGYM
jgi:hypothetical protein